MTIWTHFHVDGLYADKITLFTAGTCEACGATVVEANAVTGYDPIEHYQAIGLKEFFGPMPGEILVNEEGELSCERCEVEEDR